MKINSLAMIGLIGAINTAGIRLVAVDDIKMQTPEELTRERERARQKRKNERQWEKMTQADIDRIAAAEAKRARKARR